MKLSVADRLVLLSVLPQQGDITTLRIVSQMKDDLSFSEEEHKECKFRTEEDRVFWEDDVKGEKEVTFGEKATDIIVDAFEQLNKRKQLKVEHIPLYEKFVEKKE